MNQIMASLTAIYIGASTQDLVPTRAYLIERAAEFYCEMVSTTDISGVSVRELGQYEGMALGYIMGLYGELARSLIKAGSNLEDELAKQIRIKCPIKSLKRSES